MLLYAMFRFSIGIVLPDIIAEFGLDSFNGGVVVSASLAATTATIALSGYLSDKVGEKLVMVPGVAIYAIGLILAVSSAQYSVFLLMLIVNGLGSGFMLTPLYSLVGRLVPSHRGFGIGLISGLYNLGGFIGPAVTSLLTKQLGWKFPLLLMGYLGLIVALAQWFLVKAPAPKDQLVATRARKSPFSLLRERNIAVLSAAILLADLAFLAFISWTPKFMRESLRMNVEQTGLTFGLAIAFGGLGVLSTGFLFDKIGGRRAALMGGIVSSALTLLFFLQTESTLLAALLLLGAGFVTNTFWNLLSALAQVSVVPERIGTATGLVQNIGFVGAVLGPLIVGSIIPAFNASIALILAVTFPYIVYTLLMLAYREPRGMRAYRPLSAN